MATTTHSDMNRDRDVPRDETYNLISSDKVEGTAVYGADQKKVGRVEKLMIDKLSGKVAYAVLSFGGFFGVGSDHYPIPWSMLNYDADLGGYITPLTKEQLKNAPKFREDENWDWNRGDKVETIESYYVVLM